MSGVGVDVVAPAAPVLPTGTPSHPGPSVREATIALTEVYGPKVAIHVSAAELAAQQQAAAAAAAKAISMKAASTAGLAPGELRPSIRASTIAMTEAHGPKSANHIPASQLPKSQTVVPLVDRPSRYPEGPVEKKTATMTDAAAAAPAGALTDAAEVVVAPVAAAPALGAATVAAATTAAAAAATAAVETMSESAVVQPPVPELVLRDAEGLLPSVRESTMAMTQRYGPKQPNHVPPSELQKPAAERAAAVQANTLPLVNAAPSSTAAVSTRAKASALHRPHAVSLPALKDHQRLASGSLLAKPVREWTAQDVKQAAAQVVENKVVLTALAVGAAALTVFSVYKGVELYNHYRLGQSITEMERERPTVVHLYIHRRSPLAPSVSIPCTRVETLLRLARVPYEAHVISDPSVSPNGELPFIVFSGLRIAGAQAITDALEKELDVSLDRDLSREDTATGVALLSAVRYSLTRGYLRSVHVDRPEVMQPYYSEMNRTPDWLTRFALRRLRRRLSDVNETSGYSQLSSEQYVHELLRDVHAIEALLEHHTYLFSNDYPCSYDCALYAWLLPVVAMEDAAEVNEAFAYIVESELLTSFVRRMTELAFPDLDELVYGPLEGTAEAQEQETKTTSSQPSQPLTSEEDHPSASREQASRPPSSSSRRSLMRHSESLRRSVEAADADVDDDGDAQTRPSQREVRLPGEL